MEIKNGKALIAGSVKDGKWCEEHEWKDLSKVKLSTNYENYHKIKELAERYLGIARNILYMDSQMSPYGSWGLYNKKVDDSCRIAFHLHQVIRHELWKDRGSNKNYCVDNYPADACKIGGMKIPNFSVEIKKDEKDENNK